MNVIYLFSFLITITVCLSHAFCNLTNNKIFININRSNLNNTIEESDSLLLLFIKAEKDCPGCQDQINILQNFYNLMPKNFTKQVTFGLFNATELPGLAEQYNVHSFPTFYFIRYRYNIFNLLDFEINEESLMHFINKKLIKNWIEIETLEQFSKVKSNSKIVLLYCGNINKISNTNENVTISDIDILNKHINQYEEMSLTWTISESIHYHFNCSEPINSINDLGIHNKDIHPVILFKNFDDGEDYVKYEGPLTENGFENFLAMYASPIILDLTNENMQVTIRQSVPTIIIFLNKKEKTKTNFFFVEEMSKVLIFKPKNTE